MINVPANKLEYIGVISQSALPPHPPPPHSTPPPHPLPPPMCPVDTDINILNNRAELDFFSSYNVIYRDNLVNDDPYFGVNLHSQYYDIDSLSNLHGSLKRPIILSINIQSL
jgi:hypothetical protein